MLNDKAVRAPLQKQLQQRVRRCRKLGVNARVQLSKLWFILTDTGG